MAFDDPKAHGTSISLDEATPLATVLVDRIAKTEEIRALVLKGPLSSIENLRPARPSYDVDVLANPQGAHTLIEALTRRGWRLRPSPGFPKLMADHSRSLTHDNWPVDIDVHWNWPGFLCSEDDAFEILWSRRRNASLAGTQVFAPSRADAALIIALHILREERNLDLNSRRKSEYAFLVDRVLEEPEIRAAVRQAAVELHAQHSARRFLVDLGFTETDDHEHDPERLAEWRLHQSADHPVTGWLHDLDQKPWWHHPSTIWRAVFPSAEALRAIDPYIGSGRRELVRGWWRRLKRGLRTLPEARKTLDVTKKGLK